MFLITQNYFVMVFYLSILANCISFEIDKTYEYEYFNKLRVFTTKNLTKNSIDYEIRLKFVLDALFLNESSSIQAVRLKLNDLSTSSQTYFSDETRNSLINDVFEFEYDSQNGVVHEIRFASDKETSGSRLFKKSLVDLFDFNFKNAVSKYFVLLNFRKDLCSFLIFKDKTVSTNDSEFLNFKLQKVNEDIRPFKINGEYKKKEKVFLPQLILLR
jgi:hypothetical protein